MITLASEMTRELPAPPVFFGSLHLCCDVTLLYLVLRLDRD